MDCSPSNSSHAPQSRWACLLILLACTFASALITGLLPGCTSQTARSQHHARSVPPDLSIAIFIDGDALSPNPVLHRSRYLLEPDRSLHIAVNQDAAKHTYPPFVKFVTLQEMYAFAKLVDEYELMHASSLAGVDAKVVTNPPTVTYQVNLEAWGKSHHFTTTLDASPGVRALLNALIEAGPVQPSGQPKPVAPTLIFHSPTSMETP